MAALYSSDFPGAMLNSFARRPRQSVVPTGRFAPCGKPRVSGSVELPAHRMSLTTNRYRLLQISRFEVLNGRESDAPTIRPLFLNRRMVLAHGRKLTFSMTVALLTVGDQEFTSARMIGYSQRVSSVLRRHWDFQNVVKNHHLRLEPPRVDIFFILAVKETYFPKPAISIHISFKNVEQKLVKEI